MKTKFLLPFLAVGMIVMSCNKSKESTDSVAEVPVVDMTGAEVRALMVANGQSKWDYQDVLELANASMDMLDQTYPSRSGSRSIANIVPVVGESKAMKNGTRTASIDTSMYIFNFADSMGYTIVSNDKMMQKVIAVVENGSLSSISEVGNGDMPALYHSLLAYIAERDYMNQNKDSLANCAQAKLASATPYADDNGFVYVYSPWEWRRVGPYIQTKWGYTTEAKKMPELISCDHQMAGHPSIAAIAQIANYFQFPSSYMGHTYAWDADFINYPTNPNSVKPSSKQTIQQLYIDIMTNNFVEASKRCTEDWCPNSDVHSFCKHDNIAIILRNMGYRTLQAFVYDKMQSDINKEVIYNKLTSRMPAIVTGNNVDGKTYTWIMDGYNFQHRTISVYNADQTNCLMRIDDLDRFDLVHCNMGGYGKSNGYYSTFTYNIANPVTPDDIGPNNIIPNITNPNYSHILQFLFIMK